MWIGALLLDPSRQAVRLTALGCAPFHAPDWTFRHVLQVPAGDNYYAALNCAVFSDGSFVYIPKGVRCPMEISTYFRINAQESGQVRFVTHVLICSVMVSPNVQYEFSTISVLVMVFAVIIDTTGQAQETAHTVVACRFLSSHIP